MLFPTVEFAIFFLLVFATSWAVRPFPLLRKIILLAASYYFYAYWDWRFAVLLFETTLANFLLGLWLDNTTEEKSRRSIVAVAVVLNLSLLAYFKYWGFFVSSFSDLLIALGFQRDTKIMETLLPVGISFFTFQGISYVIDIYRRQIRATTAIVDFLLFPAFFPHLIAGPIVRAADILPQLARPVDANNIRAGFAFMLIGLGLFKKVVIAHYLAIDLVNPIFEAPSDYGSIDLLFGAYGYAVQIFCDFSAYSDLAIGVAALFGIEFRANFDQPYRAISLQDFWRRWHISLSTWLRDYLYIALGGSRLGTLKTYRNLFLTMLLGGLWHGASWNFVLWGCLHGVGLCSERFLRENCGKWFEHPLWTPIKILMVFHFVCLTWIFFNAETLSQSFEYMTAIGKNENQSIKILSPFVFSLLAVGLIGQFLPNRLLFRTEMAIRRIPLYMQATALAFVVLIVSSFGPGSLAPFIYFRF